MNARYVGAGWARLVEWAPSARSPRSTIVHRVAVLTLLLALASATRAAATDVYVTNAGSSNVSQYDVIDPGGTLALKSPATVPAGTQPFAVAVSPDGQSVYVTNLSSNNVSQYDVGAGGALVAKSTPTVPAGAGPAGVAVRPTPAPTITDLVASVEGLDLPHGIEHSLLKKLNGAQKNLDHGNTVGACDKLASFIDQVGSQSGKKIGADDAQELIDEAEAVRDSLGCGP